MAPLSDMQLNRTLSLMGDLRSADLKEICRSLRLLLSGRKAELQNRISDYMVNCRVSGENSRCLAVRDLILCAYHKETLPNFDTLLRNYQESTHKSDDDAHKSALARQIHIYFKKSPFYTLKRMVSADGNAQILARKHPKGRGTVRFTFRLRQNELKLLESSPNIRLYLVSGAINDLSYAKMQSDDRYVEFPQPIKIVYNKKVLSDNVRGIRGQPGSAKPADLTPLLQNNHRNLVELIYAYTTKNYLMHLYIVEVTPVEDLLDDILKRPHIPPENTISMIKEDAEGEDMVASKEIVSLKCPCSFMRMEYPCRSQKCEHIQCFDCYSFLTLQEQAPTWLCPICSKKIKLSTLAIDDYFYKIIQDTTDDVESVELNRDGLWSPNDLQSSLQKTRHHRSPQVSVKEEEKAIPAVQSGDEIEVIDLNSDEEEDRKEQQTQPTGKSGGAKNSALISPKSNEKVSSNTQAASKLSKAASPNKDVSRRIDQNVPPPAVKENSIETHTRRSPRNDHTLNQDTRNSNADTANQSGYLRVTHRSSLNSGNVHSNEEIGTEELPIEILSDSDEEPINDGGVPPVNTSAQAKNSVGRPQSQDISNSGDSTQGNKSPDVFEDAQITLPMQVEQNLPARNVDAGTHNVDQNKTKPESGVSGTSKEQKVPTEKPDGTPNATNSVGTITNLNVVSDATKTNVTKTNATNVRSNSTNEARAVTDKDVANVVDAATAISSTTNVNNIARTTSAPTSADATSKNTVTDVSMNASNGSISAAAGTVAVSPATFPAQGSTLNGNSISVRIPPQITSENGTNALLSTSAAHSTSAPIVRPQSYTANPSQSHKYVAQPSRAPRLYQDNVKRFESNGKQQRSMTVSPSLDVLSSRVQMPNYQKDVRFDGILPIKQQQQPQQAFMKNVQLPQQMWHQISTVQGQSRYNPVVASLPQNGQISSYGVASLPASFTPPSSLFLQRNGGVVSQPVNLQSVVFPPTVPQKRANEFISNQPPAKTRHAETTVANACATNSVPPSEMEESDLGMNYTDQSFLGNSGLTQTVVGEKNGGRNRGPKLTNQTQSDQQKKGDFPQTPLSAEIFDLDRLVGRMLNVGTKFACKDADLRSTLVHSNPDDPLMKSCKTELLRESSVSIIDYLGCMLSIGCEALSYIIRREKRNCVVMSWILTKYLTTFQAYEKNYALPVECRAIIKQIEIQRRIYRSSYELEVLFGARVDSLTSQLRNGSRYTDSKWQFSRLLKKSFDDLCNTRESRTPNLYDKYVAFQLAMFLKRSGLFFEPPCEISNEDKVNIANIDKQIEILNKAPLGSLPSVFYKSASASGVPISHDMNLNATDYVEHLKMMVSNNDHLFERMQHQQEHNNGEEELRTKSQKIVDEANEEKGEKKKKEERQLLEERIRKEARLQIEVARKKKKQLEEEKKEKERLETERKEKEKLEAERKEKERLEIERKEQERLDAERKKKERLEVERKEKERQKQEEKRLLEERMRKEARLQIEAARRKKKQLEEEKKEKQRLEAERKEQERLEVERKEKEKLEAERKEKERQKQEEKRLLKERMRKEARLKVEAATKKRKQLEEEKKKKERLEIERQMKERLESERKEKERLKAEALKREKELQAAKEREAMNAEERKKEREKLEATRIVEEKRQREKAKSENAKWKRKALEVTRFQQDALNKLRADLLNDRKLGSERQRNEIEAQSPIDNASEKKVSNVLAGQVSLNVEKPASVNGLKKRLIEVPVGNQNLEMLQQLQKSLAERQQQLQKRMKFRGVLSKKRDGPSNAEDKEAKEKTFSKEKDVKKSDAEQAKRTDEEKSKSETGLCPGEKSKMSASGLLGFSASLNGFRELLKRRKSDLNDQKKKPDDEYGPPLPPPPGIPPNRAS